MSARRLSNDVRIAEVSTIQADLARIPVAPIIKALLLDEDGLALRVQLAWPFIEWRFGLSNCICRSTAREDYNELNTPESNLRNSWSAA